MVDRVHFMLFLNIIFLCMKTEGRTIFSRRLQSLHSTNPGYRWSVQDTPSSADVDMSFSGSEGGGDPNGIQVNPVGTVGQVDEESHNGKAVELREDLVDSYHISRCFQVVAIYGFSRKNQLRSMASTIHSHHHRLLLVPYQPFS